MLQSKNQLLYISQVTKTDATKQIIPINSSHALNVPLPNHSTHLNTAQTARTNPKNDGSETNRIGISRWGLPDEQFTNNNVLHVWVKPAWRRAQKLKFLQARTRYSNVIVLVLKQMLLPVKWSMTRGISLASISHISQANRSALTYQSSGANEDHQASITAAEAQQRHVNSLLSSCAPHQKVKLINCKQSRYKQFENKDFTNSFRNCRKTEQLFRNQFHLKNTNRLEQFTYYGNVFRWRITSQRWTFRKQ